jgi:hypothetical protein
MSSVETLTIRKVADVSEAAAKAAIKTKFAGYKIASFKTERAPDGQTYYSALITRTADHPQAGLPEPPMPGGLEPDLGSGGDINDSPEDLPDAPEDEPKEDKGDKISELEGKLDHLLNLVEQLTGSGDEPAEPELPKTEHPKEHHDLPDPAQEPVGPAAGPPMGSMFSKKLAGRMHVTVVRDNSANVKIAAAKAELDAEFNPEGFKVVKMVRRDDKIVAGLVRSDTLKDRS